MNTTTHTTATPVETREQALRRLLQVARESGVQLKVDNDGEYWCTSASEPDLLHAVDPDRCSCRGFARAGRCRHQAVLWAHLGYFDTPDPDPPAPVALPVPATCETCRGLGQVETTYQTGPAAFGFLWITCPTCAGQKVAA